MRRYQTLARATAGMLVTCALFITCTDSESPQRAAAAAPPLQSAVASPPSTVLLAAGDIARCDRTGAQATAALLDLMPTGTVVALGDNAYPAGADTDYTTCYDPSWGPHKARTLPI